MWGNLVIGFDAVRTFVTIKGVRKNLLQFLIDGEFGDFDGKGVNFEGMRLELVWSGEGDSDDISEMGIEVYFGKLLTPWEEEPGAPGANPGERNGELFWELTSSRLEELRNRAEMNFGRLGISQKPQIHLLLLEEPYDDLSFQEKIQALRRRVNFELEFDPGSFPDAMSPGFAGEPGELATAILDSPEYHFIMEEMGEIRGEVPVSQKIQASGKVTLETTIESREEERLREAVSQTPFAPTTLPSEKEGTSKPGRFDPERLFSSHSLGHLFGHLLGFVMLFILLTMVAGLIVVTLGPLLVFPELQHHEAEVDLGFRAMEGSVAVIFYLIMVLLLLFAAWKVFREEGREFLALLARRSFRDKRNKDLEDQEPSAFSPRTQNSLALVFQMFLAYTAFLTLYILILEQLNIGEVVVFEPEDKLNWKFIFLLAHLAVLLQVILVLVMLGIPLYFLRVLGEGRGMKNLPGFREPTVYGSYPEHAGILGILAPTRATKESLGTIVMGLFSKKGRDFISQGGHPLDTGTLLMLFVIPVVVAAETSGDWYILFPLVVFHIFSAYVFLRKGICAAILFNFALLTVVLPERVFGEEIGKYLMMIYTGFGIIYLTHLVISLHKRLTEPEFRLGSHEFNRGIVVLAGVLLFLQAFLLLLLPIHYPAWSPDESTSTEYQVLLEEGDHHILELESVPEGTKELNGTIELVGQGELEVYLTHRENLEIWKTNRTLSKGNYTLHLLVSKEESFSLEEPEEDEDLFFIFLAREDSFYYFHYTVTGPPIDSSDMMINYVYGPPIAILGLVLALGCFSAANSHDFRGGQRILQPQRFSQSKGSGFQGLSSLQQAKTRLKPRSKDFLASEINYLHDQLITQEAQEGEEEGQQASRKNGGWEQ